MQVPCPKGQSLYPLCITAGISAMVIPPMATIGRCISFSCIRWMIAVYPSSPNIGLRFFLVVVCGGAAAYVVGTGFVVLQYILKGICRAAYNVLRPESGVRRLWACLSFKMYAVGMQFFASSTWSSMMKVAPYCRQRPALQSYGFYRFHRVSFMRSCIQRQPPSRAMRAESRYEYRSV